MKKTLLLLLVLAGVPVVYAGEGAADSPVAQVISKLQNLDAPEASDQAYVACVCEGLESATTVYASDVLVHCGDQFRPQKPGLIKQVGDLVDDLDTNVQHRLRLANLSKLWLEDKKYFSKDDKYSAFPFGLLEAAFNEADRFATKDQYRWDATRYHGVSPLEVNLRLEPVVSLNSENNKGLLLSVGLVHNFFPRRFELNGKWDSVKPLRAEDQCPLIFETRRFIERAALLVGVGYLGDDADSLAYGPGVQIKNLNLWYLYNENSSDWDWVLGADLNDLVTKMAKYFK